MKIQIPEDIDVFQKISVDFTNYRCSLGCVVELNLRTRNRYLVADGHVGMQVKAIDFVYYTVNDFERSVEFYRDTLGLTVESVNHEFGWAEFAAPPTTLAIGEKNENVPEEPGEGGVGVAFAVDDVEAAVEELSEAGMTVTMEAVDTSVCDMAMVGDPDGNPIMLHRRHDGTHGRRDPLPDGTE